VDRCAVIATHHKTGSVWMTTTFRAICAKLDMPFVNIGLETKIEADRCIPPVAFSDSHASFRHCRWILNHENVRIFHLIRDPRDVVISGMHYHRTSSEKWLFTPRDKFGGETYQAKLNRLPTEHERYVFEMDFAGGNTIRRMAGWNYGKSNSFECRYEDLIRDFEGDLFVKIAAHLGYGEGELDLCRKTFWDLAIFGGKSRRRHEIRHVRSGETGQWQGVFDRSLGEEFVARFGDVLVRLGYEQDNMWVGRLPQTRAGSGHGSDVASQSILDGR